MANFADLLRGPSPDAEAIYEHLDALAPENCIEELRFLEPGLVKKAYQVAEPNLPVMLADFVPDDVGPNIPIRHVGLNSLPAFRRFEKRFCRSPDNPRLLWGYNENSIRWATGPGYFCVEDPMETEAQLNIDYRTLPRSTIDSWPDLQPNEAGISRFIYAGMQDYMRRLSSRVTVGIAHKGEKVLGACFILVRMDAPIGSTVEMASNTTLVPDADEDDEGPNIDDVENVANADGDSAELPDSDPDQNEESETENPPKTDPGT